MWAVQCQHVSRKHISTSVVVRGVAGRVVGQRAGGQGESQRSSCLNDLEPTQNGRIHIHRLYPRWTAVQCWRVMACNIRSGVREAGSLASPSCHCLFRACGWEGADAAEDQFNVST